MISIVVPTYNEARTISRLVRGTRKYAPDSEIIIVDDNSPDGTGKIADKLMDELGNMQVIHRKGKLGLGSAIATGMSAASGKIIGVMDADLSHPPKYIPKMIEPIKNGRIDMTLGSRHIKGGAVQEWPFDRQLVSWFATFMASGLTNVKDPMSGFFFVRNSVIKDIEFKTKGYKTGLEILVKGKYDKVLEVPFVFSNRLSGQSKLNTKQYLLYCTDLLHLYLTKLKKFL